MATTFNDLANKTDPTKGAALVGYVNRDAYSRLQDTLSVGLEQKPLSLQIGLTHTRP